MRAQPIFIYENKMNVINKGYNFFTFYPNNLMKKEHTIWTYLQKYYQKLQYT